MTSSAVAASLGVSLTADSANFESGVDRAARAVRQARSTIDREAQAIARSMQEGATRGAGAFAQQIQNVSFQIADFATQLASGQSALTAFIQQGAQVAGAFGPWGAAIGAAGAVVGATAHALLGFDDEAKKTPDLVGDTIAAFNQLAGAAEEARKKIAGLSDAQKAFIGAQAGAQAETEGGKAATTAQELAAALRGRYLGEEQAKLPAQPSSPQAFEEGARQAVGAANQRVAATGQQLETAAKSGDVEQVTRMLNDLGLANTPEAAKLIESTQRIGLSKTNQAVAAELSNRTSPVVALDDVGSTSAFALLPTSQDIEAQVRATEQVEAAKAQAEQKAEAERKAAAEKAARERQSEAERAARALAQRVAAVTREAATPQDVYNQRVAEADDLFKRGAISAETYAKAIAKAKDELAQADERQLSAPARRVAEAQAEIEQLRQLQAAQGVSAAKYHEVTLEIAGERAARELGRDATQKERDAIAALTIEQEKLKEAMARSQKLDDMSLQIDQQYRLQEAQDQSAKSYYETAKAIEVERAVRELGIGATDAEIQRVRALAAEKYDAENRRKYDATYDPAAGAKEALREMADQATEFGKLAGDALKGAADLGAEAFTEFAMTGKVNMQSLAQEIERSLIQGAIKQLVNSLIGVGGQAFASWLGSGAAPAGNGQSANPAVVTQHAHGGVRSGPSIQSFENTIVSRPTFFAFARGAGVMGEGRKPEGILPLARTSSGDLGVQVAGPMPMPSGGGMRVVVNNYGSPEQVQTSVRQAGGEDVLEVTILEASRRQLNSGRMDGANKGSYGLRPRPLR